MGTRLGDSSVLAWADGAAAVLSTQAAPTMASIHELERAEEGFHGGVTCASWAKSSLQIIRANSLRLAGEFRRLERLRQTGLLDARRRHDHYLETMLLRGTACLHLVADRPDLVRASLGRTTWVPREDSVHIQHWMECDAKVELALYEGNMGQASESVDEVLLAMRGSMLGRNQRVRVHSDGLVARWRLAKAAADGAGPGTARKLDALARRLEAERAPQAEVQAILVRAGGHALQGRRSEARAALERAVRVSDAAGLSVYAACARIRLSRLDPANMRELERSAQAYFTRERVQRPERLVALYVPGFTDD